MSKTEAIVENTETDELDALLSSIDNDEIAELSTDAIASASDEAIDDVLDEIAIEETEAPVEAAPKTSKTKAKEDAPKSTGLVGSEAIIARLGGEENAKQFFCLDALIDTDKAAIEARMTSTLETIDTLAKKVKEKAVNTFAFVAGKTTLSVYTCYVLDLLNKDDDIETKDLVEVYLARPYSIGTARAQANQMLQLLPALQIAEKVGKCGLKLNPNSVIFAHYIASKTTS